MCRQDVEKPQSPHLVGTGMALPLLDLKSRRAVVSTGKLRKKSRGMWRGLSDRTSALGQERKPASSNPE